MSKTKQLVFCSLFTALIAVGAFIKIPVPVVPFTLQNARKKHGQIAFLQLDHAF